MKSNVSIVTAFFDIGRGNWEGYYSRNNNQYLYYFSYLAQMDIELIIYTESKFKNKIEEIRNSFGHLDKTKIVIWDTLFENCCQDKIEKIQSIMDDEEYKKLPVEPGCPEYWNPKYVLLNAFKSKFVNDAIQNEYVTNEQVAWIDFGYCRDIDTISKSRIWNYDFPHKINVFNIKSFDNKPVFDIMKTNTVYIQGCHIVAPKEYWKFLEEGVDKSMESMIDCGIIDDDQTMLLMAYRKNPSLFETHYIDTSENGWFVIFKKFNNA